MLVACKRAAVAVLLAESQTLHDRGAGRLAVRARRRSRAALCQRRRNPASETEPPRPNPCRSHPGLTSGRSLREARPHQETLSGYGPNMVDAKYSTMRGFSAPPAGLWPSSRARHGGNHAGLAPVQLAAVSPRRSDEGRRAGNSRGPRRAPSSSWFEDLHRLADGAALDGDFGRLASITFVASAAERCIVAVRPPASRRTASLRRRNARQQHSAGLRWPVERVLQRLDVVLQERRPDQALCAKNCAGPPLSRHRSRRAGHETAQVASRNRNTRRRRGSRLGRVRRYADPIR